MSHLFAGAPATCRLLIIAPDEFAAALLPLVEHKNLTGMPSHLIRLSAITGGIADLSLHPWEIKKVIAEGHLHHGTYYVLLAGDAGKIPVRHRFVRQPNGGADSGLDGTYNPSDNYYANLYRPGTTVVSDWDGNGDGKYNETLWPESPSAYNPDGADGYPHVAVGRVPAHTTEEMTNYVQKVIEYEEGMRMRAVNAFSFLSESNSATSKLNAPESADDIASQARLNTLPLFEQLKKQGSVTPQYPLKPGWSLFTTGSAETGIFTAKWMIHVGHGTNNGWEVKNEKEAAINSAYVRGNDSLRCSYSYPVMLSAGCDTGQLSPNAPFHEYRGLNPDTARWIWYYTDLKKAEDRATGMQIPYPVKVPVPNPYDLLTATDRSFACSWLCSSNNGGAIAYCGATVVHQGTAYSGDLFIRMLRQVNKMNILGDVWAQGSRDYFNEKLHKDEILGAPRIFLGIQTLYGDPSLRLSPVVSHGISAVMAGKRLTVFARTMHGVLTHKYYDPDLNKWTDWSHFKEGVVSSGAAAIMAGDRLTVFARTTHGTLSHRFYDPQKKKWTGWMHLEHEVICSAPAAVMANDRLVVFVRNVKGSLVQRYYDPQQQGWTNWVELDPGYISSAPSAVMAGDRLTVFARTAHGTLTHKYYDPVKQLWTAWIHLGEGRISSAPSAVMAGNRLTVFARTMHGTLTHKYYDTVKQKWTDWLHLGDGQISSAPSAVMAGDRLTIFARTMHGTLTHKYYDTQRQGWTDWVHLGDGKIS